jgi:hypothetical protein
MNTPMLPGMMDIYVRQHQHELEQKVRLNEQLREAAEATGRRSLVAASVRGLLGLAVQTAMAAIGKS